MDPLLLLPQVERIARQAGQRLREIYESNAFEQYQKADKTPVTSADYAADQLIRSELQKLTPDLPLLSEEELLPFAQRSHWPRYWLVDPLDGTQEFVAGTGDFATSIALIDNHQPVLGVIYAPIHDLLYSAVKGKGAFKEQRGVREPIHTRRFSVLDKQPLKVAMSRVQSLETITRHLSPDLDCEFHLLGSTTLKSCLVAEGGADCYLRVGPTGEWDTAAAQCILEEAGGWLRDLHLQPLSYNCKADPGNPNFISLGDQALCWEDILQV